MYIYIYYVYIYVCVFMQWQGVCLCSERFDYSQPLTVNL